MEIKNMIIAEQKALTMTPVRRREFCLILCVELKRKMMARVLRLPPREKRDWPGKAASPKVMARMAPMAAPPDSPRM